MSLEGLRNKTILVTGWTGFIGAHLVTALTKIPGVRLFLFSRSCRTRVPDGAVWVGSGLENLTQDTWREAGATHFDVVFHLAGFVAKSAADADDMDAAYTSNLVGTRRLLESLPRETGRFILSSTLDVYGPVGDDEIITEESQTLPANIYSATKLFSEHLVRIWCQRREISSAILRLGHIFGPGEDAYRKLIPTVIRSLLAGGTPKLYGTGEELRDLLFVGDAVQAILRSATVETPHLGPINIVRGQSVSVRQVIETLTEILPYHGAIEQIDSTLRGRSLRFDATRMKRLLGLTEFTRLEDGLRQEVEYFQRISADASGTTPT